MNTNNKWATDGKEHSEIGLNNLFQNGIIKNFLNNENVYTLIATKGMGKTLLLRAKKKILEDSNIGHLIIPRNDEFDEPDFHGSFSSKKIITSIETWRSIWEISIIFSILSNTNLNNDSEFKRLVDDYFGSITKISDKIKEDFKSVILNHDHRKPSYFLNEVISKLTFKEIEQFIKESSAKVFVLSDRFITSSVCLFIDAFDQTLSSKFPHNIEVWKNGQLGLLKATYKLHVRNKHIKIYSSIRQEAFSGFIDSDRTVIKGKSALLEYSKSDLQNLFIHSIKENTDYNNLKDFVGFETITNQFVCQDENLFDYIYRHSIYTPRSIVEFGKKIDMLTDKNEENVRKIVNSTGGESLVKEYLLSEKTVFLDYLKDEPEIEVFLKLIPSNALHFKALKSIKNEFAKEIGYMPDECHPFCELFNIGILGQITPDITQPNSHKQTFLKPHKFNWKKNHIIQSNENSVYLVHPSLYEKISSIKGNDYRINKQNIVGDETEWDTSFSFPSIFLSHSSYDKQSIESNFYSMFEDKMNLKYPVSLWYDKYNIKAGDDFNSAIEKGVTDSNLVIVFISQQSIKSGWVDKEWRTKHNKEIVEKKIQVICIIIDDTKSVEMPEFLQTKNFLQLKDNNWTEIIERLSLDIYKQLLQNKVI